MTRVLLAAAIVAATATPALASPAREAALLKAMPIKASIKQENKHDWLERVHHRRQLRREARQAAIEAAVSVPEPSSTPPTPSTSYSGGWAEELAAVGFPSSVIPTMLYLIDRESGGNPSAVNSSSGACGLLQLYPCPSGGLDPMTNLRLGYAKYRASGLSPWSM